MNHVAQGIEYQIRRAKGLMNERLGEEARRQRGWIARLFGARSAHKPLPDHIVLRLIRECLHASNLVVDQRVAKVNDDGWVVHLVLEVNLTDIETGQRQSAYWPGESRVTESGDRFQAAISHALNGYLRHLFLAHMG